MAKYWQTTIWSHWQELMLCCHRSPQTGVIFFKWANPGLFFVYFQSFQTNNTIFTTNICEKMYIQYTVPGFKPTTFEANYKNTLPLFKIKDFLSIWNQIQLLKIFNKWISLWYNEQWTVLNKKFRGKLNVQLSPCYRRLQKRLIERENFN